jgi:hypothetical protein
MNWWGVIKQQTDLMGNPLPETPSGNPSATRSIPSLATRARDTQQRQDIDQQAPTQTTLPEPEVQAEQSQTKQTQTDDSGTDAGSDVYNTTEKIGEYKTRMTRPARGNKAGEVAQMVDKITEAFVDVTNRNKLIREVWELAGKAKV